MRAISALLASTLAISAVFAPTAFAQDIGDTSQIATAEESSDFTPADAIKRHRHSENHRKEVCPGRERHHLHDFDGSLLRQRQQQQRYTRR